MFGLKLWGDCSGHTGRPEGLECCGLEGKNGSERPLPPESRQDVTRREVSLETALQRMWNVGMTLTLEKGNSNRHY